MPKVTLSFSPIEHLPGWEAMTITVRNRASVEVTLDMIKVACFSPMRLLDQKDSKGQTTPRDPPEALELSTSLASRRLPLDMDVPPGSQMSKSLFVLRKRRCILPIFRWADSTSHFTLQIHIA